MGLCSFHVGDPFHADNRMGLTGTLHRISAIRDRDGSVIGLTYRIGRHVAGTPALLHAWKQYNLAGPNIAEVA